MHGVLPDRAQERKVNESPLKPGGRTQLGPTTIATWHLQSYTPACISAGNG